MNDDHGDQFPGALPAPATTPSRGGARHVRMRAAYVHKVTAAVQADRDGLAHELAERTFVEETAATEAIARAARRPARSHGGRPPGQAASPMGRMGLFTRRG